jgi:glycosyltransferase involved in cell wall biosynthesis
LGLNPREETYRQVIAGVLPSDRLYGIVELQQLGYDVSFRCMRPKGSLSGLIGFINKKYGFNLTDFKTLLDLINYDVIVVNGPYSTFVTLACRILDKKIVYLDTILRPPQNICRKMIYKINLILSNGTIMYSNSQMKQCAKLFKVSPNCFKLFPFTIDVSFCQRPKRINNFTKPFVLSVGRDQARDYRTLVEAMDGLNVNLKLVTLPYLLKDVNLNNNWIEVLDNISYDELYQLYSEALFVVIPLKKWGTAYSSGTRGLLEAKVLDKGVIASNSPAMKEYAGLEEGVLYVESENVQELREKILKLLGNQDERVKLEIGGREFVKMNYNMDVFARSFGNYLSSLFMD